MDRGMQMGEGGEPSGAAPLREPSALKIWKLADSLMDMVNQHCHMDGGRVDHGCLSSNELALEVLEEMGLAKQVNGRMYNLDWDALGAMEISARSAPEAASAEGSPSPSVPAQHGAPEILDQEKGWDGMPVRVLIGQGEKREWYFCKGHPMAQLATPEGSPSHPSGPSQDSQEVRAAGPYQDDLELAAGFVAARGMPNLGQRLRDLAALLSQSPKGTAGAGRECWVRWKTEVPYPSIFEAIPDKPHHMSGPGWEWVRMVEAAGWESGPSAPKTGLRGAPRLDADDVTAARMLAAQGWCHPSTAHKVMDADLCNAIALVFAPFIGLLREGFEHVVWCSGSADFGPDGQARVGWMKGPVQWLEKVNRAIPAEAKPEPLSAAKGPDLPPSSEPAPGDVGAAGGAA